MVVHRSRRSSEVNVGLGRRCSGGGSDFKVLVVRSSGVGGVLLLFLMVGLRRVVLRSRSHRGSRRLGCGRRWRRSLRCDRRRLGGRRWRRSSGRRLRCGRRCLCGRRWRRSRVVLRSWSSVVFVPGRPVVLYVARSLGVVLLRRSSVVDRSRSCNRRRSSDRRLRCSRCRLGGRSWRLSCGRRSRSRVVSRSNSGVDWCVPRGRSWGGVVHGAWGRSRMLPGAWSQSRMLSGAWSWSRMLPGA